MKKKRFPLTLVIILVAVIILIISLLLIILVPENIIHPSIKEILKEINKALVLSVIIGTITKLIAEDINKVKMNDAKMRRLGIHSIGEGLLDKKQANIMFGGNGYDYPKELKFVFITGVVFIREFEKRIMEAVKNGCEFKLLIADTERSIDYLERATLMRSKPDPFGSYVNQIEMVNSLIAKMQKEASEKGYKGSIEVRHYTDEYRYNYRIAKYRKDDVTIVRAWINFQPINKTAIDQSLTVLGEYNDNEKLDVLTQVEKESRNIVVSIDDSFDLLWDLYK